MELTKIIYAGAIGQGLLIIVLLLTAIRSNFKANLFLLILVLFMLKVIVIGYAGLAGWNVEWLKRYSIYPLFAHGPVVYCYCLFMTQKQPHAYRFLLHFLWLLLPFLWIELGLYQSNFGLNLLYVSSFLHVIGYYILSIYVLYQYSATIKLNFSNTEKYKLRWLMVLLSSLGALLFIDLGLTMLGGVLFNNPSYFEIPHLLVLESLYVFGLGIFAAKQPEIIFDKPLVQSNRKYERSSLNFQKAELISTTIMSILKQEKLYLENGLSLSQLSDKLDIPPSHLSQVLNENMKVSFYDLINRLRIEHSQSLLVCKSNESKSILDIAFESGFNNKTSFNSAFKKYTDSTPSTYRRKNQR